MLRFIPQTGLGDAVFSLPLAMAMETIKQPCEFIVSAPELFVGLEYVKARKAAPFLTSENLAEQGQRLRYSRYQSTFWENYFYRVELPPGCEPKIRLSDAQDMVYNHLGRLVTNHIHETEWIAPPSDYAIVGPPRVAHRHKRTGAVVAAPSREVYESAIARARAKGLKIVAVGFQETYTSPHLADINLTDQLSLYQLLLFAQRATLCVSQISALTAICSAFKVPCDYLPGMHETMEQHAMHVLGVVWRGGTL